MRDESALHDECLPHGRGNDYHMTQPVQDYCFLFLCSHHTYIYKATQLFSLAFVEEV